jgi:uncharacterized repeat protein (TIGR03803 family)
MMMLPTCGLFSFARAKSRKNDDVGKFSLSKLNLSKLSLSTMACIVFAFCVAAAIASPAQTFTTLVQFDNENGMYPNGSLIQGTDGNFYGTTLSGGGHYNAGSVFQITVGGAVTTLYPGCSPTSCGSSPQAPLVQGTDGNFYGTFPTGGSPKMACDNWGCGTVFKIVPGAKHLTVLHNFDSSDGYFPVSGLVEGTDGNLYGATLVGGAFNGGTLFKITPAGKLTTLYTFCAQPNCSDGKGPHAALVQGTDGNFYGTTYEGGAFGGGTVFKIASSGTLTTLHSFNGTDGSSPLGGLVQGTDGNFYGTTAAAGEGGDSAGTAFKMTPAGAFSTLYNFCSQPGCSDGKGAYGGLVQATDGNFYGTTIESADPCPNGCGTVFKLTLGGELTTLHTFCAGGNCADGAEPIGGLVQGTDGSFYGTAETGGFASESCGGGCGTAFNLSVGLGPFVETKTTSGPVGAVVIILGNNLTGTTGVSFNGTPAAFTVVSASEITATVPSGATNGVVTVVTTGITLKSNVIFRVTPQIKTFTPKSAKVGSLVKITGVSLTQTSEVSFGGVAASSFTVNSDTLVTATVPTGAQTGAITITTPGGTAASKTSFTVTE